MLRILPAFAVAMAATGVTATDANSATAATTAIASALAQERTDTAPPVHTVGWTLRGWEQRARLALWDRSGSMLGRLSPDGILQRFHAEVDAEYHLDLISSGFSLTEEYEWFRRGSGARFWTGSVNNRRLVQEAEIAGGLELGRSWSVALDLFHHRTLQAQRSLIRIRFARELFDGRGRAFLGGTLKEEKPDADLELGFTWADGPATLTVAAGALDVFNDLIYQTLEVFPGFADTAVDYTRHPVALRAAAELRPAAGLRVEAFGLALTPTRLYAERQREPGAGFRQDERYGYAGGLVEWSPDARTAVGAFGTWTRARLERAPLAAGVPEDAFDLTEREWRVGGYGIHRLRGPFAVEGRAARAFRDFDRVRPPDAPEPGIDYRDRAWWGRLDVVYRPRAGFRGTLGLDFTARGVTGPRLPTREHLASNDWRLRIDLGWAVGRRALFRLGTNVDLDGDPRFDRSSFDGAHGQFVLYW